METEEYAGLVPEKFGFGLVEAEQTATYIVMREPSRLLGNLSLSDAFTGTTESRQKRINSASALMDEEAYLLSSSLWRWVDSNLSEVHDHRPRANKKKETGDVVELPQMTDQKLSLSEWHESDSKVDRSDSRAWDEKEQAVGGVELLEMTEQKAHKLREEIPGLVILKDRSLPLIKPIVPNSDNEKPWHLEMIGLQKEERARNNNSKSEKITVAVCDTGIDSTHPELKGKVRGAARVNATSRTVSWHDDSSDTEKHGTHVAGLICGNEVGVAPGSQVINVEMLPGGNGRLAHFVLALKWIARQPEISIVNISAGLHGYVEGLHAVLAEVLRMGVLPVVAVGNEGAGRTRSPGNYVDALSVGALDSNRSIWPFSGGGTVLVNHHLYTVPNVVAPGVNVRSCVPDNGWETWSGTSMAAPVVSGIAALLLEKHGPMRVLDLKQMIEDACMDLGRNRERQGAGLVQVPR